MVWLVTLILLSSHEVASAFERATKAWHVLFNRKLSLVPLIVNAKLLACHDLARCEKANRVICIGVDLAGKVETLDIWITAMVDEACLIPIEHTIEAKWEELILVYLLNQRLFLIFLC